MDSLIEHLNINVEDLIGNEVIQWDAIIATLSSFQDVNIALSDSLINLIKHIKRHYENDMQRAKNIYALKSQQYEILNTKLQLMELKSQQCERSDESDETENEEINEEEMFFSGSKLESVNTFNFPQMDDSLSLINDNIKAQNNDITLINEFEVYQNKLVDVDIQKECEDFKMIDELVYQNNQYLKLAASWKKQCQATMLKVEEMKKKKTCLSNETMI